MGKFLSLFLTEVAHNFKPGESVNTRHHGSGVIHALDGKHNLVVAVKSGKEEKHYQIPHTQIKRN